VGLIYRGSATAASLNITITVTTTVKRATQNTAILSLRTTKPASPNRQMPSQAFRPVAQAALPYVVGLIHGKAPAAAASLNIVITTTAIWRVMEHVIPLFRTTESRMRIVPPPGKTVELRPTQPIRR